MSDTCKTCEEHLRRSCRMCEFSPDRRYCEETCNYDHIRYEPMLKRCPECGKEWDE